MYNLIKKSKLVFVMLNFNKNYELYLSIWTGFYSTEIISVSGIGPVPIPGIGPVSSYLKMVIFLSAANGRQT